MRRVRCAIYTRKSSEEGLEQDFNSLDAQREACAAYVLSQASEGWTLLPDRYDDGGISGGTLERPALQRLLADTAAGCVDIIVIYKVDRLTRSLLDFAKLVEALDKAGTSFVSITQSFNTTTSMGRLTLNMLLSFAQFEREVTAERIRDKLAASKAKGMWMGGVPPLGYKPDGRSLAIVEEHAALIQHLFGRYLALGSVRVLQEELFRQQISVPRRMSMSGKLTGGSQFSRGQLYKILKNVTYAGQIPHKDKTYPGLHKAIVEPELFKRTQSKLASNLQGSKSLARAATTSLLAGKLVDTAGQPLIATHATKAQVRYRYYVSRELHEARSLSGLRIPAREIESLVAEEVGKLFADPLELAVTAWLDIPADQLWHLEAQCRVVRADVGRRTPFTLPRLVEQVQVLQSGIAITCSTVAVGEALEVDRQPGAPATIELVSTARITRLGRATRLVHDNGIVAGQHADHSLVGLIVKARRWWSVLREGEISMTELARREGVTSSYVCRVMRVAFLSPAVVKAILAGRQRASTNVELLRSESAVPPSWWAQSALLLPAHAAPDERLL